MSFKKVKGLVKKTVIIRNTIQTFIDVYSSKNRVH